MKVYLCGPVSLGGTASLETMMENRKRFFEIEQKLLAQYSKWEIVNPIRIQQELLPDEHRWNKIMASMILHLLDCDSIALLRNWPKSRGARLEALIAKELSFPVVYEEFFYDDPF